MISSDDSNDVFLSIGNNVRLEAMIEQKIGDC